jgi:hypothetical protein
MHRLNIGRYVGVPGEVVTLRLNVHGSGAVAATLDGQDLGAGRQFRLKTSAGEEPLLQLALFGATGESCFVGVSPD